MINIYDVNGKVLMQAEITSSAIRVEELSKSDYISLSWNSTEKVILPAGAYIVHKYKIDKVREVTRQFLLLESYEPTQSDEMSWKYTPEFQHPKMVLSKIPFFIRTRNSKNEVIKQYDFNFFGTMVTIADRLKDFLNNELKFGNAGWVINYDTTNTNAINVSFSDNDFMSALTAITNAIGDNCEWHIDYDNETIHIGNVLRDDLPIVTLKVGENVGIPSITNSKEDYYNSFAVFGGTRNITQVNDKGENISSSDIKLQLSKGSGTTEIGGKKISYSIDEFSTIDMRQNKNEQLFTKILNFAHIYPSLNTYVYNVRGREKYVLQDGNKIPLTYNADGSVKTYKTFTVWYVRMAYPTTEKIADKKLVNTTVDNGVTHYWYDFEVTDDLLINGKNIGCSFEANFNKGALSTPLAGRGTNGDYVGFELTYHKEASSTHTADDVDSSNFAVLAGDFEIIYQEDNDLIIPTNAKDMIIPKGESLPSYKCNITVLYNIAMAESIYTEDAQKRLLDAAMKEIKRLLSDLNNYTVKSYPQVFEAKNPCLRISQKVVYDDGNGYQLNTRVRKISTNIDFEFVQEITIGNEAIKGNTAQLKEDVKEIIASGGSGSGGGGNYTTSQLKNLIGKYGVNYFISKQFDDEAHSLITFAKGLIAKGLAELMMGAKFGNNAKITELGEAFFSAIKSLDYDNAAEQGFSVEKEKNGKYHAFFTNLTIWGKARFHELEVRKLSYSGGNIYLSGAGSKLIKVVPVKKSVSADGVTSWVETTEEDVERFGWKCYLLADNGTTATMNYWQEGDQARCQTMGEIVSGGTYQNASNKSYWRTIPNGGVSTQNEKIYGTKTETYLDEDGNEQTREVQVELYDGQAFAWIVIGKHCGDIDGYDDEFSVGYDGTNPAPLETRDIPSAGDTIVLDGNRHRNKQGEYDKTDRQNVIILETTGEYAPRIACYANITEYKHTFTKSVNGSNKEVSLSVFETSPKGGTKINSSRFEWISDDGSTINIINYRGDWDGNNTYHKNDQVNHNNAVWVCIANSGVDVTVEPTEGSSYWKKVLSGGKGEKGDKGDKGDKGEDGLSGNGIVPAYVRSKDNPTPPTSTDKSNLDNGWSLVIPSVADVENVIYSDSSWTDYNDGVNTWKKSPTTAGGYTSSCLVTFTTTQANQTVMFVIKAFSEPRYDYIFLSEIDAASVPSRPTSNGWYRAVSGNGVELLVTDIVATAGTHTVYVCYGKDNSVDYNGDYGLFRIEKMTDIDIPLWQSNGKEVSTRDDSGAIKSKIESWSEPFKVTGENGEAAVSYTVTLTRGSNGTTQGLYVGVTRYIGTACTTGTIIDFGMSCKAYTDGTLAVGLTDRLQTSDNYIDFAAFPKAKSFTVELLDKNGNKVATGNYSSGDDAISILVEDAPLVFDTDDNGIVSQSVTKTAKVKVMRGNTNVTNDCTSESSRDDLSLNCMCDVTKDEANDCINVSVQGSWIVKNDVIIDGVNQGEVSTTSGYAVAQFVYDSVVYFAQVPFSVNVAKFTGVVAFNNKQYESKFTEISTRFGNTPTNKDLTDAESRITQTAREISLSVSEKSIGRRNLLVGSAFLREDNHVEITDGVRIEMNSGYQGTNCIHSIDDTDGTPHYRGAFWDGSQGGKSIKITKGKKYVLSCYYKTNDANGRIFLEALYTDEQANAKRTGNVPTYLTQSNFVATKLNQWELFTTVIDTTNAGEKDNYLAFNIFEYSNGNFGRINAYICRPMVEEGDTYNGWTLSQDDYDIIGANLIDNSRTLDAGGNVFEAKGQKALVGDAYELTYIGSDDYNTFYRIKGSTFKLNTDYTISFEVRGDAKYMGVYAYYPITNTKFTFYAEQQNGAMTEVTDGGKVDNYVALIQVKELSKQQRVWSHFRFKDRLPEQIYFQFPKNAEQTGVTSWGVTITRPKIEVGAVVTEYTERKSDLVDKASLKEAGIEITSDMVELYGNQVKVSGAKGGTPVAMFEKGMLNSNLINADKIMARQLQTNGSNGQSVSIENGLMRVYGTNGRCNIEFGVNPNGEAILSYYDKDGKWLYDLGPNKLDGGQLKESTLDGEKYVSALSFFGTNNFFTSKTYINVAVKQVLGNYSISLFGTNSYVDDDQEIEKNNAAHMGYKPFERLSASKVTTLYRYTAPRQSGTIIKDEIYGLTTPALAKQADGKYFTRNRDLAINGQLANLAPAGYYFRQSEQVMMAPYPMPSAEIQPDKFPAYSIRCLNITEDSTGTVMSGFNGMMSSLMRTIKIQI